MMRRVGGEGDIGECRLYYGNDGFGSDIRSLLVASLGFCCFCTSCCVWLYICIESEMVLII